jgi:pyruvate/2-oxoglutarate dehydrogenase complex dihydrolipoamide dehydrogenase (E3) component
MSRDLKTDLCVIGAGAAGLSIAAVAAQLGAKVVLVERGRMGGECLNFGCVPSKALLAASKVAHTVSNAHLFGIDAVPAVDFKRVHAHVRSAIEAIAPHDSVERFEKLGVTVIRGDAKFTGPQEIVVGDRLIRAHRTVIATGSAPVVPPIPGLEQVRYFTNENIFDNDVLPEHLIVLGGGSIGVEIGQAYRRLGAAVTIVERETAMPRDDQELARPLLQHLIDEGVVIRERASVTAVSPDGQGIKLTIEEAGQTTQLRGSHLLVAAGRSARTAGLGLEAAGIQFDKAGIIVDKQLKTSTHGIYAAGDVVDGPRFTHVCSYHAGIVIKNALFRMPAKIDYRSLPWVTYTDPELAQIGMTEEAGRKVHGENLRVVKVPFSASDRAQTERGTAGTVKLIAHSRGQILGASILGAHAGELAHLWVLAIEQKLNLRKIAQMMAPYPTWGELNKMAAAESSKPLLAHPMTHLLVRALSWLP